MVWLFQEKGKQCSKQINQSKEEAKKKKTRRRRERVKNPMKTTLFKRTITQKKQQFKTKILQP
jgi:hypothetical protein